MQQCPFCDKVYDESEVWRSLGMLKLLLHRGRLKKAPNHRDSIRWNAVMLICQYCPIHRILILRCSGQADCDLFEPALYKGFVKFCKVSTLCIDEIL